MDSTFFSLDEVSSVEREALACVYRVHRLNAFDLYSWISHIGWSVSHDLWHDDLRSRWGPVRVAFVFI